MRTLLRPAILLSLLMVSAAPIFGQATTGAITGTVTHEGVPIPGVTITIASPAMQGTRVSSSYVNGDYNFAAIPPGNYSLTFELEGMSPVVKKVEVGLARIERVNAEMELARVTQEVVVTAAPPTVLETTEVQSNYTTELVDSLPIGRTIQAVTQFAPTTATSGDGIVIAGAQWYDSLYLVNGAVISEESNGQPLNVFVEDAIQESSVLVGSISAEYGRFTGGVVSTITRSGGNEFSGSIRDSLTNLAWSGTSAFGEASPESNVDETYEATLGGRIMRDRLWFFLGGRYADRYARGFFTKSAVARPLTESTESRAEYKLTGQLTAKHSIVGSFLQLDLEQTNWCTVYGCWEPSTIDPRRRVPQQMVTGHYSGMYGSNALMEAGYASSEKRSQDSGGDHRTTNFNDPRDIALGTWAEDKTYGGIWGAPLFCGSCADTVSSNDSYNIKGTRYVATQDRGTHAIVAGYEKFTGSRLSSFYQSGSDFMLYVGVSPPEREGDGALRPIVSAGDVITWAPILLLSPGTDFTTESVFVNDKWDLGSKWSFNIGARYDRNDDTDSAGHPVAHDSTVSPRLGAIYDIRGDGRFRVNTSYSKYVAKIWDGVGDAGGGAGVPWYIDYEYRGPTVGGAGSGLDSFDVLEEVFRWFLAQGGTQAADLLLDAKAPGLNYRVRDLVSPSTDEWTIGFGSQLRGNGTLRIDYIDRTWRDFYIETTTPGDVVENPVVPGSFLDMLTAGNSDDFMRTYRAVILQGGFRAAERVTVGGYYTWSQSRGNTQRTYRTSSYPEYKTFPQNDPVGYLGTDQTHKARLWASYGQRLRALGTINVSVLESVESGRPYSAAVTDPPRGLPITPYVTNPGYANPPARVDYYFSDRGAYRWDTMTSTDLAVNYEFPLRKARLFAQADVLNIFNEQAQIGGDTSVKLISRFNPFTETPKECPQGQADCKGFNWQKAATFGKPTGPASYQTPRTYQFSVGMRF